ncbi:hypothetical protein LCGC14_2442970 [marine sediment metagenome]|uniref:Uncharacterized protein n=1 Tax=marine sediment metagenome TaxID=412755 RepID=A0A0F9BIM6_9ZZZZ
MSASGKDSNWSLAASGIRAGIWEASLDYRGKEAPEQPGIEVSHLGQPLDGLEVAAIPGRARAWSLRFAIPAELLSDGVHSFIVTETDTGVTLGAFSIAMGDALEGDIRAEMQLLRAELDVLKKAFRRQCMSSC